MKGMKKNYAAALAALLLLTVFPVSGLGGTVVASGSCGEKVAWTLDSAGTLTISGEGDVYDYSFMVEPMPPWTEHREQIKTVVVEEGVTGVGMAFFFGCSALTSVSLPDSLKRIGAVAFERCSNLQDLSIPAGVTDISASSISGSAWYQSQPAGVLYVGDMALAYTGEAPENTTVRVREGTKRIGESCFAYKQGISGIILPDSVTEIGTNAFEGCRDLKSITVPGGVRTIGQWCFASCTNLQSVTLPEGLTEIGNGAFNECAALQSIRLPSTLKKIEQNAFAYCASLETLAFPASLETMEGGFVGCERLRSFTVDAANQTFADLDGCLYNKEKSVLLAYPMGRTETAFSVPDGVHEIAENAFRGVCGLETVLLPASVEGVGDRAFSGCQSLRQMQLSDGLREIGFAAFEQCSALNNVDVPQSVIHIGGGAFSGTPFYSSFPEGLVCLGRVAFRYNGMGSESGTVQIPDGIVEIADNCFDSGIENRPLLRGVTLPDSLQRIGDRAFVSKKIISEIQLPAGVTEIGDSAFEGCSGLKQITLPAALTSLGMDAFQDCTALEKVTFGDGLTAIGMQTFGGCRALSEIRLPETLTEIGAYAFADCKSLRSIALPSALQNVDPTAFLGCNNLSFPEGTGIPTRADDSGFLVLLTPEQMMYDIHVKAAPIEEDAVLVSLLKGTYTYTKAWDFHADFSDADVNINSVRASILLPLGHDGNTFEVYRIGENGEAEKLETTVDYEHVSFRLNKDESRIVLIDTETEVPFTLGKVDEDDEVGVSDARFALRAAVGLENYLPFTAAFSACDTDNDGEIEVSDARNILRVAVGLDKF